MSGVAELPGPYLVWANLDAYCEVEGNQPVAIAEFRDWADAVCDLLGADWRDGRFWHEPLKSKEVAILFLKRIQFAQLPGEVYATVVRSANKMLEHLRRDRQAERIAKSAAAKQQLPPAEPDVPKAQTDNGQDESVQSDSVPAGFLGGAALADALGVHPSRRVAFDRRLARERTTRALGDYCWKEVSNPPPNSARYLYSLASSKLHDLAEGYKKPKPA